MIKAALLHHCPSWLFQKCPQRYTETSINQVILVTKAKVNHHMVQKTRIMSKYICACVYVFMCMHVYIFWSVLVFNLRGFTMISLSIPSPLSDSLSLILPVSYISQQGFISA